MVLVLVTFLENTEELKALEEYRSRAKKIRDEYGAETVYRLNIKERFIGNFEEESIRILKFPSIQHLKDWLSDPRYQAIVSLREKGYRKVTLTIIEEVIV
ncbi:DUF1330 domain-containing protein [Nostoc sp.]|uniref:DUF1330 domain-containing protein n=1 Tax=Nostoc sp. TaxID=1180 RepID=UPI002FFC4685